MPGGLPGASREPVGTFFEARRRSMTILKRPGRVPDPILGPGRVRKIDQKYTFGRKGGLGERLRKRFACSRGFLSDFCPIFEQISMIFRCFFDTFFEASIRFFF